MSSDIQIGEFATWVGTMPADEAYDYTSNFACPFAQFLIASGRAERPNVDPCHWNDKAAGKFDRRRVPAWIDTAIGKVDHALPHYGHTFGALADRLSCLKALAQEPSNG